jgi:hypothetical protein
MRKPNPPGGGKSDYQIRLAAEKATTIAIAVNLVAVTLQIITRCG